MEVDEETPLLLNQEEEEEEQENSNQQEALLDNIQQDIQDNIQDSTQGPSSSSSRSKWTLKSIFYSPSVSAPKSSGLLYKTTADKQEPGRSSSDKQEPGQSSDSITSPLLSPASSSASSIKCWACWESANSYRNPLVRVCRGCKDRELQYIHQECINSYISSLPVPRRPRSPRPRQLEEGLLSGDEEEVLYDCTRCRDPYIVQQVEISPFWIIWDDKWLRIVSLLLGFGFLVMIITLFAIILNVIFGQDYILFYIFDIPVYALAVAFVITWFCCCWYHGCIRP